MDLVCNAIDVPGREVNTTASRGVAFLGDPPCRVADVAIETDTQFRTDLFGGNATQASDYATMLVGAISEVYDASNVILNITFLRIWTSSDPWNQNGTADQLYQFRDYWNDNMTSEQRNGVHFLSGRSLGGGVVRRHDLLRRLRLRTFCQPERLLPYPLQDQSNQNWDFMVTAHSGATTSARAHASAVAAVNIDNCGNGDCSQAPGTIMSYCHQCGNGTGDVNLNFHRRTSTHGCWPTSDGTGQYSGRSADAI